MHRAADLMADYLEHVHEYTVLPKIAPGDVRCRLPGTPPQDPEPLDRILDDYRRLIEPNTTHWNHPGFMAYFAVTGSGPGIIGESLAAALNVAIVPALLVQLTGDMAIDDGSTTVSTASLLRAQPAALVTTRL